MIGYLLSDDLLFTSRVTGTARAVGLEVRTARSQSQLTNLLGQAAPACILLDLHNPGLDLAALLNSLPTLRPFVVGFGSHVDTATLKAARDAGCNLVLPRSKFVEDLPTQLPGWFARAQRG